MGHRLSPPYPHPDLPFVSLAVLARQKGVPRHHSTRTPSPHPLQTQPVAQVHSLLTGSPPMSGPPLPDSLAGALRHGLVVSSRPYRAVGIVCLLLRAFLGPHPFSQKPWSSGPSCGCRGRHVADSSCRLSPEDPSGLCLPFGRWLPSPTWYMYSHFWWLDFVLNMNY